MVRAQARLIEHLGIDSLLAVAGGSMGGMQALEWGVRFPERVRGLIPIVAPARSYPQAIAYNEVGRQAIMADPEWRGGDYYGGPGPCGAGHRPHAGHDHVSKRRVHARKFGRDIVPARARPSVHAVHLVPGGELSRVPGEKTGGSVRRQHVPVS